MAYCRIIATSSSTRYASPLSVTIRAVARSASAVTLNGSLYLSRYCVKLSTAVSLPSKSRSRVKTRSGKRAL